MDTFTDKAKALRAWRRGTKTSETRTTRAQLDRALLRLESAMGTPYKLELDNMNPGDGRTYKVMDSHGRCPLGESPRRSAKDMLETIHAVLAALEYRAQEVH